MKALLRSYEKQNRRIDAETLESAIKGGSLVALQLMFGELDPRYHQAVNVSPKLNQSYMTLNPRPSGWWRQTFKYQWSIWHDSRLELTPVQLALISPASQAIVDLLVSKGADTSRIICCSKDIHSSRDFEEANRRFLDAGLILQDHEGNPLMKKSRS